MIAQMETLFFGAENVESLLCEFSLEISLLWIIINLVIEIFCYKIISEYKKELDDSSSYSELPEPVFVPLNVSTEDMIAEYQDRKAPNFTLLTIYEESSGSLETLTDLKSFGARFEPIKVDQADEPIEPVPMKHLAFSKMMRFSRSQYELPIEDEITTSCIQAATSPKDSKSQPLFDDDLPRKAPPRPRTPDFIELLRRNVPEKVESIFDEEPSEAIEILDRLDEEKFSKSMQRKLTPNEAVKLLVACNIL